jgi:hypothetical protein
MPRTTSSRYASFVIAGFVNGEPPVASAMMAWAAVNTVLNIVSVRLISSYCNCDVNFEVSVIFKEDTVRSCSANLCKTVDVV